MELIIDKVKRIEGDSGLYCLSDCIATISNHVGRDYKMSFIDGWNFSYYKREASNTQLISSSLNISEYNTLKNLKDYHGIQLNELEYMSTSSLISKLLIEKEKNIPLLVSFDSYWCPWDWGYQKYHNKHHYFFIVDYDYKNNQFVCVDPYFKKEKESLSRSEFQKGIQKIFRFTFTEEKDLKIEECLETLQSSTKSIMLNAHHLTDLAEDIAKQFDLKKESEGFEDIFTSKLNGLFIRFMQTRCNFSIALEYLSEMSNSENLRLLSEKWWEIGIKWMSLRKMIYKMWFMNNNQERLRTQISEKIMQIANIENDCFEKMCALSFFTAEDVEAVQPVQKIHLAEANENLTYIKLDNFFNNKAFGRNIENDWNADFTGTGHYYLLNTKQNHSWLKKDNLAFFTPSLSSDMPDNISCSGEIIEISPNKFSSIMILASSEFGNSIDEVLIKYEDGSTKGLKIEITDYILEPQFGEKIVWEGNAAYKSGNTIVPLNETAYLFGKVFALDFKKKMSAIILPYYPNLHVFSITLVN